MHFSLTSPPSDMLVRFDEALRDLRHHFFVTLVSDDPSKQILSVHRQVQKYALSRLDTNTCQLCFGISVQLLRENFPKRSPFAESLDTQWSQAELCISHIVAINNVLSSFDDRVQIPKTFPPLLLDAAIYLWERGFLEQGRILPRRARLLCIGDEDRLLLSEINSFLGAILSDLGEIREAEECFKAQVQDWRRNMVELQKTGAPATIYDEIQFANA